MTEDILKIICDEFNVTRLLIGMKASRRDPNHIVEAKQTAAYFLWRCTRLTTAQIASIVGYESRENVSMAKNKVKQVAEGNREYKRILEQLEGKILRD